MDKTLITFIKNPALGKAKTRIARTTGDVKALEIYKKLLKHTRLVCSQSLAERHLYYSTFIDEQDEWSTDIFHKYLQEGEDLGARMEAAFKRAFEQGAQKVIIVGSDCASLNVEIIDAAFEALEKDSFVIGPAEDGGYYLLGMQAFSPLVFRGKAWSTEGLLETTLNELAANNYSVHLLPVLSDIDTEEDWLKYGWD